MENKDMPATPLVDDKISTYEAEIFYGMTKREMMAMHVLGGILSIPVHDSYGSFIVNGSPEEAAKVAVAHADALLKELEK